MAFRRTAISLISITLVTAGIAAVYLWYNFTSRSNLILVVPANCHWFYHFQTKQIRSKTDDEKPRYLDSIAKAISAMQAFKNVKEPGEVGIALFSDIIVFENDHGRYLALSLTSEPRLQRFFKEVIPRELTGGLISGKSCTFVKASSQNLYFAFKHKAFVIFQPFDTTDNLQVLEAGLASVFPEKGGALITAIPEVQKLYEQDCDIVFYHPGSSKLKSHGIAIKEASGKSKRTEFYTEGKGEPNKWNAQSADFPLHVLLQNDINRLQNEQFEFDPKSTSYLDRTMDIMFQYIKIYTK